MPLNGPRCPECGRQAVLVPNTVIYGENPKWDGNTWKCPNLDCDCYIGAASGDPMASPIGTMAGPRLRSLRTRIVNVIRPQFSSGERKKSSVLKELSKKMGWTGRLNISALSIEQCLAVLAIIQPGFREDIDEVQAPITWQDERD